MALIVNLSWPGGPLHGTFRVPASKSESNRALILRALTGGGTIENLSAAHDTQLLARLLELPADTPAYDCEDAGTTLRFLTAYAAVANRQCIIHGTARMHQRPIGPLVEALRELGAKITYLGQEGFPPLQLNGFQYTGQTEVTVRADISSQFVSALLLVAPTLPNGLVVRFAGAVSSWPYLLLTGTVLARWGARAYPEPAPAAENPALLTETEPAAATARRPLPPLRISAMHVQPGGLEPSTHVIEADWSSAAFGYAAFVLNVLALRNGDEQDRASLLLPGLHYPSLQADSRVAEWVKLLGVNTEATPQGVRLFWGERVAEAPGLNFTDCPDLALPFIVTLAGITASADFQGLHSLRFKESDRLAALTTELARFGTELLELDEGEASLVARPDETMVVEGQRVSTYHDHRMAMAFAALAMLGPLTIENPAVVRKSFPDFWNVLIELGFEVEFEDEDAGINS